MDGKITQVISRTILILIIPLISIIYSVSNIYKPNLHILRTFIDGLIPFNKYFVIPYGYWFVYLYGALLYFAVVNGKHFIRLLMSMVSGMFICYIIFFLFPTTVPRPAINGNGVFDILMAWVYALDKPYNCFPSIHVLNAFLVTLFLCKYHHEKAIRMFAVVSYIMITLSTLFIYQHYVLDAISATLLGMTMYLLYTNDYIWSKVPVKRLLNYMGWVKVKNDSSV